MRNSFFKYLLLSGGNPASRSELETEILPYTFNSNSYKLRNYRIYGNTVNEESVGDLVTEGEHSGEYCIPVTISNGANTQTTNIYLPEQIRKVGDEFEYIDFRRKKQYKMRKNLWNENYNRTIKDNTIRYVPIFVGNGEFTCSTTAPKQTGDTDSNNSRYVFLLSGNVNAGAKNALNGVSLNAPITVTAENGYITFAYRYIESYNVYPWNYQTQIEKGSIATTYEPYIEDTELDVTLPALPTFPGTNTLSVGTTVQPSKVYLQGKISEAKTVSAEPVQTNVQSLQPLSLDNDDLQLDVMPIDKSEFQINDISEVPVEDENSVEEIPETENFETSGDEENAE